MTNPLKGEIEIILGEETYKCRLTIDSLVKIENELDASIIELTSFIAEGKVRLKYLLVILKYALRGGGNDFQDNKIKEIITGAGLVKSAVAVANLLAQTLTDPEAENDEEFDEKKPQEETG